MNAAQKKPIEELRMSGAEFDRIMGHALQVKPEPPKAKSKKTKSAAKKKTAKK